MSLLPNQILPQTVPIGTVNEDKTVTMEHDWWLFFYNVFLNALTPNGTPVVDIIANEVFAPRITLPTIDQVLNQIQIETFLPRQTPKISFPSDSQNILANQIFGRS